MTTLRQQIHDAMKEILAEHPDGIQAKELNKKILARVPNPTPQTWKTVGATMSYWTDNSDDFIRERRKGEGVFYALTQNMPDTADDVSDEEDETIDNEAPQSSRREKDFYDSFASYLLYAKDDDDGGRLDECTEALKVGDRRFGPDKWLTPDVIGIFRPMDDDVPFPHEIVSAEIKMTSKDSIKAFGQACAYRLFSHKIYLVIPKPRNYPRIESLCHIYGIGLVYFDPDVRKITPFIYTTKLLAQRYTPDMDAANSIIPKDIRDRLRNKETRSR